MAGETPALRSRVQYCFQELVKDSLDLFELAREEMIRILNPVDLFGLRQRIIKSLDVRVRSVLVERSLNDELGFQHSKQEVEIHDRNGNSQPHQHCDARVGSSNPKSDTRAERKPDEADRNSREARGEEIERRLDVIAFADAVTVAPYTLSDSAEIEAQRRQACFDGSLRGSESHLVVHRPAIERVRVAHERRAAGLNAGIPLDKGFERSRRARD